MEVILAHLLSLFRKILYIGFFIFVVHGYEFLIHTVIEGFIYAGKTASSGSGDNLVSIRNPSSIIDAGFTVAQPILEHIRSFSGWDVVTHLHDILITVICALGVLISYFVIAIQVFVTYIEFSLISTLGFILIPFGISKHTAFLSEKVFGSIISFGVKLMVLSLLVSVTVPVLKSFSLPEDPNWTELFSLLVVCGAIAALAWHAPGIAAGMISGGPSLTAGTAGGTAVAAGAGLLLGAGGAIATKKALSAGLGGIGSATQKAASALGVISGGASAGGGSSGGGPENSSTMFSTVNQRAAGAIKASASVLTDKLSAPVVRFADSVKEAYKSGETLGKNALRDSSSQDSAYSASTDTQNQNSSRKSSLLSGATVGLHLAKESLPPTAQPSSGITPEIKAEEKQA